ncbi:unnamed protein product [Heterosigma akashiwo]
MTKEELAENLGTIARSGSRAFVKVFLQCFGKKKSLAALAAVGQTLVAGIIGQFGVGFYSAFMVGDAVSVTRHSPRGAPAVWSSRGEGSFSLEDTAPGEARRGCRIVLQLREGMEEYCRKPRLEEIVRKYSNFVGFPIKLDGEVVNTVQAVWAMGKDDEQYREFYRFVAHAYDDPLFTLHFRADAPLDVKALFFFPGFHTEKFGMGRMEPGVLIEHKAPDLLPDWLRFVKGVADSEDLPLSVSREKAQDSRLLRRLGDVLTRKILRFLDEQARKDTEKYKKEFFPEFGFFLKEGICQDPRYQEQLSKLLYFETAKGGWRAVLARRLPGPVPPGAGRDLLPLRARPSHGGGLTLLRGVQEGEQGRVLPLLGHRRLRDDQPGHLWRQEAGHGGEHGAEAGGRPEGEGGGTDGGGREGAVRLAPDGAGRQSQRRHRHPPPGGLAGHHHGP